MIKLKKIEKNCLTILAKKSNTKEEKNWLKWKFKEYKIKNSDISELKIRMDIVPVSLSYCAGSNRKRMGNFKICARR